MNFILDKLDFGGKDRRDIWAMAGTCETLKSCLARYPAKLILRDKWKQSQITGKAFWDFLTMSLPLITSYANRHVILVSTC